MNRTRLLVALMIVIALLAGVYLGRGSSKTEAPSAKQPYVSLSASEMVLPGVWMGRTFRGAVPVVSLTRLPSAKLNGLFYALISPGRPILAIEPYVGAMPASGSTFKTPVGEALVSPDGKYAYIEDPQGNMLRIESFTGKVDSILPSLQVKPSSN